MAAPSYPQPGSVRAASGREVRLAVNGCDHVLRLDGSERLSTVLRRDLRLTGVKEGCLEGECGACTVLIDDLPVNACLMLAFQAEGRQITTVEGLAGPDGMLSSLQQAFVDNGAVQCGYCTPGMVMAAQGLLLRNPAPDEVEIRDALAGNLCRCTGFQGIFAAVKAEVAP